MENKEREKRQTLERPKGKGGKPVRESLQKTRETITKRWFGLGGGGGLICETLEERDSGVV